MLQKAEAGAPRFGRVLVQKFFALGPAVPSGAHTAGVESCLTRAIMDVAPRSQSSGPLTSSPCECPSYPSLPSAFSEITQHNDQNQEIRTVPALSLQPTDLNQMSPVEPLMCFRAKEKNITVAPCPVSEPSAYLVSLSPLRSRSVSFSLVTWTVVKGTDRHFSFVEGASV